MDDIEDEEELSGSAHSAQDDNDDVSDDVADNSGADDDRVSGGRGHRSRMQASRRSDKEGRGANATSTSSREMRGGGSARGNNGAGGSSSASNDVERGGSASSSVTKGRLIASSKRPNISSNASTLLYETDYHAKAPVASEIDPFSDDNEPQFGYTGRSSAIAPTPTQQSIRLVPPVANGTTVPSAATLALTSTTGGKKRQLPLSFSQQQPTSSTNVPNTSQATAKSKNMHTGWDD
jgi:hypothetical protein